MEIKVQSLPLLATRLGNLLMVVAISLLVGCGEQAPPPAPPAPGVMVSKVSTQTIRETSEYIGRTIAVNDVELRARVQGYLLERNFLEGDDVETGDVLFVIDPAIYEANVAAAQGEVEQAEAEVVRTTDDLERFEKLIKTKAVSEQMLDKGRSDKLQADARLTSAQAKLQSTENDLEHTVVRAPISGRIGRSIISVGNLVDSSSGPLARLVELDPVSDRDLIAVKQRRMKAGRDVESLQDVEVRLKLPGNDEYAEIGRLDFIDNAVDPNTGTVTVRARFPNPDKLLVPGLFVRAILGREETVNKLMIPEQSVQEDQAGKFVMVVDADNKVEIRRVKTGKGVNGQLVVLDGLQEGETVVVEGIQKVRPGMTVTTKQAPMPGKTGS